MSSARKVFGLSVTVAALVAVSQPAVSQTMHRLVVTPYVGAYMPAADVGRASVSENGTSAEFALRHKNTLALGGTASYWLSDRWAVEVGAAYSATDVKASTSVPFGNGALGISGKEHANLWLGSAKAMVNLMPAASDFRLRFGFGPAVISRAGKAYRSDSETSVSGKTSYGGAFSLCTRVPVRGPLALRLRAEDYLYQSNLKIRDKGDPSASMSFGRRTQNDFVLSAGLQIGFDW